MSFVCGVSTIKACWLCSFYTTRTLNEDAARGRCTRSLPALCSAKTACSDASCLHETCICASIMPEPAQYPSSASIRLGLAQTLPVALSVLAYGMVYGLLTREASLSVWEAFFSSALVFAGAAQFVALEMWSHPLPVAALIVTTGIINLRHVLMGASLAPWLKGLPPAVSGPLLFFLVDESWALSIGACSKKAADIGFLLGSGMLLWGTWVFATLAGRAVGASIPDPERFGLDFAFTAVFLALLAGLWKGKQDLPPWLVAAAVALLVHHVAPGKWYIVAGGLAGSLTGFGRPHAS